ncbi:uncharacterized protein LOC121860553 isoform X2 [Homarus americanus]|uniref:uncharacterized protein LOC121860553 isoform X2 n=1 Tax=Homarus americanus TaxID=6706 RepID=UPI001C448689|nr:uncharacterized protein LOC121860553 isoform X2 [Homarus americanus]
MRWRLWCVVVTVALAGADEGDNNEGNSLDGASTTAGEGAAAVAAAATTATASGIFGPQLRVILGALENVDDMLRSTLPDVDRFQCLERLMCSLASSQLEPDTPSLPVPSLPAFDPTFQQGFIQDSSTIQQGFQQVLQQGLQNPAFQNPAFQNAAFQNPAFQNPAFQNPAFRPPPPAGSFPQFHPPPTGQVGQGSFQTFQPTIGGTNFQNSFQNFRENPDTLTQNPNRRENRPPLLRRRRPIRRRPQRNGFLSFLSDLGRRKKRSASDSSRQERSIFDTLFSGFTSQTVMGLLDQMTTQYSFHPYTHAAYMGYSGSPRRCESMYPACPSTPEEMIEVFNNFHKYYPSGIPFKDNLPWPLNVMLP